MVSPQSSVSPNVQPQPSRKIWFELKGTLRFNRSNTERIPFQERIIVPAPCTATPLFNATLTVLHFHSHGPIFNLQTYLALPTCSDIPVSLLREIISLSCHACTPLWYSILNRQSILQCPRDIYASRTFT